MSMVISTLVAMLFFQLLVGALSQTSTGVLWDPDAAMIIYAPNP